MNDNRNNIDSENSKEDLKAWMECHPQEYGEVTLEMGEADLFSVFLMGQAAFITSPEFQKRLEDMTDTDSVNVGELVEILRKSGFTEKILTNPNGDEVVFLEIPRIIHKIIINCEISDLDCRASDYRFEVYRLRIAGSWINLIAVHGL